MHFHHFIHFIDFMHSLVRLIISFHWYEHVTSFLFLMFVFYSFIRSFMFLFIHHLWILLVSWIRSLFPFRFISSLVISIRVGSFRFVRSLESCNFIHSYKHAFKCSVIHSVIGLCVFSLMHFIHSFAHSVHAFIPFQSSPLGSFIHNQFSETQLNTGQFDSLRFTHSCFTLSLSLIDSLFIHWIISRHVVHSFNHLMRSSI